MSWTAVLIAAVVAVAVFAVVRRTLELLLSVAVAAAVLVGGYAVAAHLTRSSSSSGPSASSGGPTRSAGTGDTSTRASSAAGASSGVPVRYTAHRAPVPILMYHVLGTAPAGSPYPDLFLAPTDFRAQMAYLKSHGFRAVTLRQVWDNWHRRRGTLPAKPVVITFDDGENAQLRVAEPILRAYGWPAVLNLVVDHYRHQPAAIGRRAVERLISEGWEIDSHTVSHVKLTTLSNAQLTAEVARSRKDLQADFHVAADFFCYPAGFYDPRVIAAVRRAGYVAATTTKPGLAARTSPSFELPRVRIDRGLALSTFAAEVSRGDFAGAGAATGGE
jgi:peptidoglycan/xylan/chitin deacetylase (PgdA/CDA1 family)